MRAIVTLLLISLSLVSCDRQPGNERPGRSPASNQMKNSSPDTIISQVSSRYDVKPAFDRALLRGVWWAAGELSPTAAYSITDSLINFVDPDPEGYYRYEIHYDTLVVFRMEYEPFAIIKQLTKDSLIMEFSNDTVKFVHTEPKGE